MPIVRIPGKGDVRFPDNMTPYQIQLAIEREILPGRKPEAISAPKRPEGGFLTGLQGIGAATAAIPAYFEKAVEEIRDELKSPVEKAREAARVREFGPVAARSQAQMEAAKQQTNVQMAEPEFDTMLGRGLYSGTSSFIQNLPGTVASVIKQTPVPALANIAAVTAPATYQKYRERGASVGEAALGTSLETGIELGTEYIPLKKAVSLLGKVGFGSFIKQYLGRELPSEAVATILQNAVDTAIANPDKTWADYVKELPAALGETAIATLVPTTVLAGASKVAQTLQREPRAATEETGEEPGAEAGATSRRPSPPPPPPADMGALTKALGPVGGKVTLQEPSGPQEYTYQGLDEDGSVLLADPDGNVFAEDPAQISAAMKVGAVEPENGLGAVAFGEDVTEGLPPVRAEAAPAPAPSGAAVIRPDDVFRGNGVPKITVDQTDKPFVVRATKQDQIDDMIASGLVRPKPGGYGKQQNAQIYFGESETSIPSSIFARPKEGSFTIVGKSENLVGKEGPISIDQLEHIWENRDGKLVDILPDIIKRNQEFAPTSTPAPAPVPAPPSSITPKEAPIVRFRKIATGIEASAPPIAEGFTRLWRGNRPGENGKGLLFTNDLPGIALPFQEGYGGDLTYIDVPSNDLPAYESQGAAAPGAEFFLPPALASTALPLSNFPPSPTAATPAVESIAAPEQMPIDEDVGPYLQEYSKFRTAKQILEIEDNARAIAAERGASSVSRKDIFEAGMAFDDALFKEPSPAPARARVPAPAAAPTVEPAPKAKAEPYRPDKREPAVVWENFNKAFETQEYPSVNWAIGSDWGMGTTASAAFSPEGYRRAATERMERLYGPDPTATTAPEPVTEQTLRDAGFTSGEIASWRSGQGSKDYAEKAGRGFIYYKGDFTPATAENVAKITGLIEADIAKNAATRERLIATDTGKRTVLVGDARPQLLAENLKDLETSDSKLKAKIEGLNRQLERSTKAASRDQRRPYQSIEAPLPAAQKEALEEISKVPSLSRGVRKLLKRWQTGKINDADLAAEIADLSEYVDRMKDGRNYRAAQKGRARGADRIMEVLLREKRKGNVSAETVDFVSWVLKGNPNLAEDLAISMRVTKQEGVLGQYDDVLRLMTLFKNRASDTAAVHEMLHHTERMMPPDVQAEIRKAWLREFNKAAEKGKSNVDINTFFQALRALHGRTNFTIGYGPAKETYGPDKGWDIAMNLMDAGFVPYSYYQYVNPSEFWAVNATEIMRKRFDVKDSTLARIRNWLGELIEKAKGLFNLSPTSPLIKALDSLAKADGKFNSLTMLQEEGARYMNVSSLPERRARQVLERARAIEANGMRNSVDEIEDVIDDLDAVYKTLPENTEIRRAVDGASNKLENLLYRIEDARRPSNQNVAETEYERAYRETSAAEDAYYDFLQNEDDERRFMDRRTKARKEFEKEIDRLFDAKEAALKRLRDIIANEQKATLRTLNTGTPDEMKDAIAAVQKPDDKVMNDRANIQKQNRGCD